MPSAVQHKQTVMSLAEDLAAGRTTSRELIERALARIADPAGEGAHIFIKVYTDTARAAADAQDRLRASRTCRLAAGRVAGVDQRSIRRGRRAYPGRL